MTKKTPSSLYLKHRSGATHELRGRRASKLYKALSAGCPQPEYTALVEAGYEGFLAHDGQVYDFEALTLEQFNAGGG